MVLRGSPLPPLPIDYTVLTDPLVQAQSSLTFSTLIPALNPPPVDPYFNTEFLLGIETNDPICFSVPSPFLEIPIDENTDPTEKERLSNKFGAERIGPCTAGPWRCAKIELGDGFTFQTEIFVDELIRQYIVSITDATRSQPDISLGSSPRGSLGLFRASQAQALIRGRDYVLPDDVKELAVAVLAHRVIVAAPARMRGVTARDIITTVVDDTPVPGAQAAGWFRR